MKNLKENLFLILVLVGLLISLYLTYVHYSYSEYFCSVQKNCNKVLTSKYSQIFNLPISLFGVIYFLVLSGAWLSFKNFFNLPTLLVKLFNKFFKPLIFGGVLISLISIYLQIFVIKEICFYCLGIDLILLVLPFLVMNVPIRRN